MLNHNHIFNDPIHGVMDFNEQQKNLIVKYIDTDIFQRLRRINQLGVTDYVFPGATHSRFSHSLGACYLAKNLCESLKNEFNNQEEINATILSALLHDIGHGPFSHSFEYVLNDNLPNEKKISHDYGWQNKFLDEFASKSYEFNEEISIVKKILNLKNNFKKSIFSSQLDVDRLDYLLRDSHFCGVPYGKIDLRWILKSIDVVEKDDSKIFSIKSKGIGAVEHYLSARRLMNKNIYYNSKVCAVQYYYKEFILSLEEYISSKELFPNNLMRFLKNYFEYKNNNVSTNNFIEENYKLYKNLTDDDITIQLKIMNELNHKSKACNIANYLLNRHLPNCFNIDKEKYKNISLIINDFKDTLSDNDKWKINLEKFNIQTYKSNSDPIYVTENSNLVNILDKSDILNFHSDKDENKYILYIDPTIDNYEKILDAIK